MMFLSSIIIIQQHFRRCRAIAAAFAMSGASCGSLIAGSIIPRLLAIYGWRGTMWIVAGFLLNGVVAGALYIPVGEPTCDVLSSCRGKGSASKKEEEEDLALKSPIYKGSEGKDAGSGLLQASESKSAPSESKPKSTSGPKCDWVANVCDVSLLKDVCFLLYLTGTFTFNITMNLSMQHLVSAAIFKGVDPAYASLLITILGISTLPSYLLMGLLGALKIVNSVLLYGVTVAITGVVVSFMFLATDFLTICIFVAAFGAAYGKC